MQVITVLVALAVGCGHAAGMASPVKVSGQIPTVEVKDCPAGLNGHPLLTWMAPGYAAYMTEHLSINFQRQDPGMTLLSVRCLKAPEMTTAANETTNAVTRVTLTAPVELLVRRGGSGNRHRVIGTVTATEHRQDGKVSHRFDFELQRDEQL